MISSCLKRLCGSGSGCHGKATAAAASRYRRGLSQLASGQDQSLPPPPGPPGLPLLGNLFDIDLKMMTTQNNRPLYDKYGPIFRMNILGQDLIYISDVDLARQVLRDRSSDFTNSNSFRNAFGWFFPTSIIVVEGPQWQRIRRIMQRAIHGLDLDGVMKTMHEVFERADEMRLSRTEGKPCDVHRLSADMTFDTFGYWGYNVNFDFLGGHNKDLLEACDTVASSLSDRTMTQPFAWMWDLPTARNRRVRKGLATILAYAEKVRGAREAELTDTGMQSSMLDAMIIASRAEEDAKDRLNEQEIIDNIATIFFGAYDTTSATLAFTMQYLAEYQEVQKTLAAELADVDLSAVRRDALDKLPFLDMVCKETHRLRSTAFAFGRSAKRDLNLGGYSVKKGANVVIHHVALTARDPALWGGQTDLDTFRPERWSDIKPHRLASLPFGFGARMCIGAQLATLEHKFFVAGLVSRFHWQVDPERPMELTIKLGMCPKDGCWLIPTRRSGEA